MLVRVERALAERARGRPRGRRRGSRSSRLRLRAADPLGARRLVEPRAPPRAPARKLAMSSSSVSAVGGDGVAGGVDVDPAVRRGRGSARSARRCCGSRGMSSLCWRPECQGVAAPVMPDRVVGALDQEAVAVARARRTRARAPPAAAPTTRPAARRRWRRSRSPGAGAGSRRPRGRRSPSAAAAPATRSSRRRRRPAARGRRPAATAPSGPV